MPSISKIIKFDAAHAIHNYSGPCANLHGHTWKLEILIDYHHLDETGISIDFKDLKKILKNIVPDHKLMLSSEWPVELINVLKKYFGNNIVILDFEPTAENLSKYFWGLLDKELSRFDTYVKHHLTVRVWESETAFAEFKG